MGLHLAVKRAQEKKKGKLTAVKRAKKADR